MHVTGKFSSASVDLSGVLSVTFTVNEKEKALDEIDDIRECKLTIDAKKYRASRSLDANSYAWQLFDRMAKVLGTDKETVYRMQIEKYGVFVDLLVPCEAVERLYTTFRVVDVLEDGYGLETEHGLIDGVKVRCYYGSSTYDTKEMSDLIRGTVQDASDIGIKDTLTHGEEQRLLESWGKRKG